MCNTYGFFYSSEEIVRSLIQSSPQWKKIVKTFMNIC